MKATHLSVLLGLLIFTRVDVFYHRIDACLVEDPVGHIDRRPCAQRQPNRIARPGVEFQSGGTIRVGPHEDAGEIGPVPHVVHDDHQDLGVNAIEHGNRYNPARWVSIRLEESDRALTVTVQDEGPGVRLAEAPVDPLADRGRGLELMRGLVDEVRTSRDVGRTVLVKFKASE